MATASSARAALALIALALLLAGPTGSAQDPSSIVPTDLEERTTVSLSVVRIRIEPTRGATSGVCRRLGVGELVAVTRENVVIRQAPTRDVARLRRAIAELRTGSRTSLLDAVYHAARELDAQRERPVLILLSDGEDTSSFHTASDIEEQIRRRPDLTVFTIGVGVRRGDGNEPNRELLKRLAARTHGEFFEVTEGQSTSDVFSRIRDIMDNEAILTVVNPRATTEAPKIKVYSRNANCAVTLLHTLDDESAGREPIPRPYPSPPQSFEAELDPTRFDTLRRGAEQAVDPACAGRMHDRGLLGSAWFLEAGPGGASGCVPDITKDHGRLFAPPHTVVHNDRLRLSARPFEVPIGPFDALPRHPAAGELGKKSSSRKGEESLRYHTFVWYISPGTGSQLLEGLPWDVPRPGRPANGSYASSVNAC